MIFHRVDKDSTGSITWWEFINFETIRILKQRHKVRLYNITIKWNERTNSIEIWSLSLISKENFVSDDAHIKQELEITLTLVVNVI